VSSVGNQAIQAVRMPSISVIIPTHNRATMVTEAVDSVLAQTGLVGVSVEVIVVDDGSTDDTAARLAPYVERGAVRYVFQQNAGAGPARNRGIDEARGSWIAFLDSDDLWQPCHLSTHLAAAAALPDVKVFFSDFTATVGGQALPERGVDQWTGTTGSWKNVFPTKLDSTALGISQATGPFAIYRGNLFGPLLIRPCMPCWTTVVAKESLSRDVRFSEHLPTWEDYWFSCKLAEENEFVFLDLPTALNRAHKAPRLTNASFMARLRCHLDVCSRVYVPSASRHRPSDVEVFAAFAGLKKTLFKELVKAERTEEARQIVEELRLMGVCGREAAFLFYYGLVHLPAAVAHPIVRLRRRTERA
jgi:glycosyltransferase involved in cell wall biosynthesis